MVDLGTAGVILQAATALVVLIGGLVALAITPRRRHTVAFSLLLVLWGGFLVAGNVATLAYRAGDLARAHELLLLHSVLQGIALLPLAVFVLCYPPSRSLDLESTPRVLAVLGPAVAVLGIVLLDPTLFHEGFVDPSVSNASRWGPAKVGVLTLFRLGIYAALVRLVVTHRRSGNRTERRQALYAALGLSLFVGYESVEDLVLFAGPWALGGPMPGPEVLAFGAVSALGLAVLVWAGWRLTTGHPPIDASTRPLVQASLVVPAAFGLLAGASLAWGSMPSLQADSVWRLGAVGLLGHAVTRFEHPRMGTRLPTWAAWLGGLAAAAGSLLALQLGFEALLSSRLRAFVVLQGLVLGAAVLTSWRRPDLVWALLRRLRRTNSLGGDAQRKLEIYEAALLADREPDALAELREKLAISTHEHELIQRLVPGGKQPPAEQVPNSGTLLSDRYQLGEVVGRGAHTRVHRARDRTLDRTVAIKVLEDPPGTDPTALRSFLHEARVGLRVRHPHVVHVEELGEHEGHPYLVLEHAEGGSLDQRLPEHGLDPTEAGRIMEGVLAGLQHLHDRGLLHRDVKPSNVLLTKDGNAKIGDLGLARPWDPARTQELGPGSGPRQGTPAYMSPEALLGRPLSPRSDVYGAGAILSEALAGRHYLGLEQAPTETVRRSVLRRSPRLDQVPSPLRPVVEKALAKDPERRFASAREMRAALRDALGSTREDAPRSGPLAAVDEPAGPEHRG